MKKLILKENQVKKLIDNILSEQPTIRNISSEKGYRICGLSLVEENGVFYLKNPETNELSELPKLSEITGIVRGNRRKGFQLSINMDSETGYAKDLGEYLDRVGCRPEAERPAFNHMSVLIFDDIKYKIPMWAFLVYNTANGVIPINDNNLKMLPETDGTTIKLGATRTENFGFSFIPALIARPTPQKGGETPREIPPKTKPIVLDLTSPFKFDSVEFVEGSDSQQKLNSFIEEVNKYYTDKNIGPIEVLASASIDGEPNQKLKNGMLRKDYDLDLSQRRAIHIANILTKATGIKFVGKGIGQTEQFAPGMKYPQSNTTETAPNRRLIVKMPEIKVKA